MFARYVNFDCIAAARRSCANTLPLCACWILSPSASTPNVMQVFASDDGGISWRQVGSLGPLWWPQLFRCASGVYVMGTKGIISINNGVFISKMLDDAGTLYVQLSTAPPELRSRRVCCLLVVRSLCCKQEALLDTVEPWCADGVTPWQSHKAPAL